MISVLIPLADSTLRGVSMRLHHPLEGMLVCVRWYMAYQLSLRLLPVLAKVFRPRPRRRSWRMDETCILVGGQWKYVYRAVDKLGCRMDFLLTARRDHAAARRLFERAIDLQDVPERTTIDKGGANKAAVLRIQADAGLSTVLRQSKYLNNLVEQDHRAITRKTQPMLGFESIWSAHRLLAGIETMHIPLHEVLPTLVKRSMRSDDEFAQPA